MWWLMFNVVDAAICVGVAFMLLDSLRVHRPEPVAAPLTQSPNP